MEEKYMRRAIELAKSGVGKVNPNPLVGAVIVKDGQIISEGYHAKYGDLHAERNAFRNLKNAEEAKGAEMYVTLEPCCHQGKQPPCTQAIIEHGIRKVYVGSNDPNVLVAGKGIRQLREAGIEVATEVLKEECDALNPVFFHYITTKFRKALQYATEQLTTVKFNTYSEVLFISKSVGTAVAAAYAKQYNINARQIFLFTQYLQS